MRRGRGVQVGTHRNHDHFVQFMPSSLIAKPSGREGLTDGSARAAATYEAHRRHHLYTQPHAAHSQCDTPACMDLSMQK